jgi:beta-glucosidase
VGWDVTPEGIYWAIKFLYEKYRKPLVISENGIPCHDWVSTDGKVHDPNRIDFVKRYLRNVDRANQEGIPVEGYFYWSATDNFEWTLGFAPRFGLVYVDYETQERIIKDSGWWYRKVIESN